MAHFFDLSRELRDMIYIYLTIDSVALAGGDTLEPTVSIFNAPVPAMLRVNRQLSTEYWREVQKSLVLQIVAPKDNIRDQLRLRTAPASLRSAIRECIIYIRINCWQCVGPRDDDSSGEDVETLCSMRARRYNKASEYFLKQMPNLRNVRFRIGLEAQGGPEPEWPRSSHPKETWISLLSLHEVHPAVCEVDVVQCSDKREFKAYCYGPRMPGLRRLALWRKSGGWRSPPWSIPDETEA